MKMTLMSGIRRAKAPSFLPPFPALQLYLGMLSSLQGEDQPELFTPAAAEDEEEVTRN